MPVEKEVPMKPPNGDDEEAVHGGVWSSEAWSVLDAPGELIATSC